MTVRQALRRDEGLALPVAIAILAIIALLSASALALATRSMDRANRDRRVTRALAAAEAGTDVASWRMNKTLATSPVTGVLGLATELVLSLGCTGVDALGVVQVDALANSSLPGSVPPENRVTPVSGWCPPTSWEDLDDTSGREVRFRYAVSPGVIVNGEDGVTRLVERRIVGWGQSRGGPSGEVGGRGRRVMLVVRADPSPSGPLSVFRRHRFVECPAGAPYEDPDAWPAGTAFDAGCPG